MLCTAIVAPCECISPHISPYLPAPRLCRAIVAPWESSGGAETVRVVLSFDRLRRHVSVSVCVGGRHLSARWYGDKYVQPETVERQRGTCVLSSAGWTRVREPRLGSPAETDCPLKRWLEYTNTCPSASRARDMGRRGEMWGRCSASRFASRVVRGHVVEGEGDGEGQRVQQQHGGEEDA